MASQSKQRTQAKNWHGNDWNVELAPFMFSGAKKGNYDVKSAAWSYIVDLPSHIHERLDSLDRYVKSFQFSFFVMAD